MSDRSFGLFEPDALLPAQFHAAFRGRAAGGGARRLMLAVLRDALDCYQKYAFAQDVNGRQLFDEANAWISGSERDWHFSFENICDALEIDPGYVRHGIYSWRRQALAVPHHCPPASASFDGGAVSAG